MKGFPYGFSLGAGILRERFVASLSFLHTRPVDKAVRIVEQKGGKTDDGGQVGKVVHARRHPQDDKHEIVGNVRECVKGTAEKEQGRRHHTRRHGDGAYDEIVRVKISQNEIQNDGGNDGQTDANQPFLQGQFADLDFVFTLFGRVFQPADTRDYGGRQAHKQVGDHFAVIPRADGDNAVQNAENDDHNLPDKIPFGDENERSDAEQGRDQAQRIKILA